MDIPTSLNQVKAFQNLPPDQLAWLAENAEIRQIPEGSTLFKKGDPVDFMHVIVKGALKLSVPQAGQMRDVGLLEAGSITGLLPYSRMKEASGYGIAMEPTTILSLHKRHFTTMIREHHEMVENLVHTMTSRVRDFTQMQQQNDKMMALGKLSAGLAHELNNPSSAVVRSARELKKHLAYLPENFKNVIKIALQDEQIDKINGLLFQKLSASPVKNSLMEKSEKEDELLDWLDGQGLSDFEDLCDNLVDYGFTINDLEMIQQTVNPQDLGTILKWIDDNITTEKLVLEIEEASRRINDLVSSVKSYTHMDQAPERSYVDVHDGIENTLTMLNHRIRKENVQIIKNFQSDIPKINIYQSEINQVWTNIIDNALDAVESESEKRVEISTKVNHQNVEVTIQDNGPGIPQDIIHNIFDPFYTTKPIGKGTGLGLDIVKKIVDRHGGMITAKSQPKKTTFKICFPLD